jgi:hypothetical protein
MEAVLGSLGTAIYSKDGGSRHRGYVIKWGLLGPLVQKWSHNRDPDPARVQELVDHHARGGYFPCMLHVACLSPEPNRTTATGPLWVYDGNHRREALARIDDPDIVCVVDVLMATCHRQVREAFDAINKAVPVPAIYFTDDDDEEGIINNNNNNSADNKCKIKLMSDILALVREYETKHKEFVSTSSRCHAPNFNRDAFVDSLHSMHKALGGRATIKDIGDILTDLNAHYAGNRMCSPHHSIKPTVVEKCRKHGFWLFLEKAVPVEHVTRLWLSRYSNGTNNNNNNNNNRSLEATVLPTFETLSVSESR